MSKGKQREGEAQYEEVIAEIRRRGPERMGFMTSWAWIDDPKRLAFMLSRYKFVAKMIGGTAHVLEIGCGDGFGSRIVARSVGKLTAIDFDPEFIESCIATASDRYPIEFRRHDLLKGPVQGNYGAFYSLDVLEHIERKNEDLFLSNATASLEQGGVEIIGTPSLRVAGFCVEVFPAWPRELQDTSRPEGHTADILRQCVYVLNERRGRAYRL